MGMSINGPEAHRLARELADLTGESVIGAVTGSLRERLERLRAEQREGMTAALLVVGRGASKRLSRELRVSDPDELPNDGAGCPADPRQLCGHRHPS